jgi:hypothetical protein
MYLSLNPRMTFWRRMTLSVMALSRSTSRSMSWWSWKTELLSNCPTVSSRSPAQSQVGPFFLHSEPRPGAPSSAQALCMGSHSHQGLGLFPIGLGPTEQKVPHFTG